MPIRIPQIVAQQGPDLGPAPMAPSGLGAIGAAPAAALQQTGETINKAITDYNKINMQLTEQDMKLDVQSKLSLLGDHLAQEDIALKQEGVEPDQLAPEFEKRASERISNLASQLKYPASAAEFRVKAEHQAQIETTKQRYKALDVKEARISVNTALANQQDALTAVNGETAEGYFAESSKTLRNQALQSIETRVNELVTTRVWSKERAESEIKQYKSEIQIGRATKQFEMPGYGNAVISSLRKGQWSGVSGERQLALAEKLTNEQLAKTKQQKQEEKDAQKEVSDSAEKIITDLLVVGQPGNAREMLSNARRFMEPTRYEHWSNAITGAEKGGKNDIDTERRLQQQVYSVFSRVNPGQPKSLAEVQQDMAEVDAAYGATQPLINTETHTRFMNELQQRITKTQEDPFLARRHAQAEQDMRNLLTTQGAMVPSLDLQVRAVLDNEMADLRRNSAFFGKGTEDPFDWFNRRAPLAMGRVSSIATAVQGDLAKQMRLGTGQPYTLSGNEYTDKQNLLAQRNTFKSEADFKDQARYIRDWYEIQKARARVQEMQTPGKVLPLNSSPPPTTAPSTPSTGGGKTLGRPQEKK